MLLLATRTDHDVSGFSIGIFLLAMRQPIRIAAVVDGIKTTFRCLFGLAHGGAEETEMICDI